MIRLGRIVCCAVLLLAALPDSTFAQKSVADVLGRPATPEGQLKTYLEELMLFSYVENSYVWNLGKSGRGDVNELRFYDHDAGYTFNALEFSVKKDPSERYRLGYGVVLTAGVDSQKNHSLGIFRDRDDQGPFFRNTEKIDLPEAVTRSTGMDAVLPGSAARSASTRDWTALIRSGFVGLWFDPDEDAALYPNGVVADGRPQKYFGSSNGWPISAEPTTLPSFTMRLPLA